MIRHPSGRRVRIKAVRPNEGIHAAYLKKLLDLIDEMNRSIAWWVEASWKAAGPRLAQDASASRSMDATMRDLTRRWKSRFKKASKDISMGFATGTMKASDFAFKHALKQAGIAVEFRPTRAMNEKFQAVLHENVSLIRSIPAEHLADIEQLVHRSVREGRNLSDLQTELAERFEVSQSRARLIARDQNNKATSAMNRARQKELGINKGIWRHTSASKEPREEHLDADGEEFDLDKGMLIDGEYIFPGEEINCGCISESIVEGYDTEESDEEEAS